MAEQAIQQIKLKKLLNKYNVSFPDEPNEVKVSKPIFLIFGGKGVGKTTLAYTFEGTIANINFDNQGAPIREQFMDMDPVNKNRIKVYNAMEFYDPSSFESAQETAVITYNYVIDVILEKMPPVDYIVIDPLEVLVPKILEQVMRYNNSLKPFSGVENPNIWKERNLYVNAIHKKALDKARIGVIYIAYYDKDNSLYEEDTEGGTAEQKEPKYMDMVRFESQYIYEVEKLINKSTQKTKYRITANTSKRDKLVKTGEIVYLTDYNKPFMKKSTIKALYPDLITDPNIVPDSIEKIEKIKIAGVENEEEVEKDEGGFF